MGLPAGTGKEQEENLVFKWQRAYFLTGERRLSVLHISPHILILWASPVEKVTEMLQPEKTFRVSLGKGKKKSMGLDLFLF